MEKEGIRSREIEGILNLMQMQFNKVKSSIQTDNKKREWKKKSNIRNQIGDITIDCTDIEILWDTYEQL